MRYSLVTRSFCIALAIVFPVSTALAEMRGAVLQSSGPALVNGAAAKRGSAVLVGDVVESQKGTTATVTSAGNSVLVYGGSKVKYEGGSIQVQRGAAELTTASGMTARIDDVSVMPSDKSSKYEIGKKDGQILIAAVSGTVRVSNGNEAVLLAAGEMATLDQQVDRRGPSAPVETEHERRFKISRRVAFLILFGAAGAAGVAAWLSTDNPKPMSPTTP